MKRSKTTNSHELPRSVSLSSSNSRTKEIHISNHSESARLSQVSRQQPQKYRYNRLQSKEAKRTTQGARSFRKTNDGFLTRRAFSSIISGASRTSNATRDPSCPTESNLARSSGAGSPRKKIQALIFRYLSNTFKTTSSVENLEELNFSLESKPSNQLSAAASPTTSVSYQRHNRESETKRYRFKSVGGYGIGKNIRNLKQSFTFLPKDQDLLDETYLYPAFTQHQRCERCDKLIKNPMLSSLFGGTTVLGEVKSATVQLRCNRRQRKFATKLVSKEKEVELLWQYGHIEVEYNDNLYTTFHVSDICNIEFANSAGTTLMVSAYYSVDGLKECSEPKRDEFLFTFGSMEETQEWAEIFLKGLKSLVPVYDEVINSLQENSDTLNRDHVECLLRKKARVLELCLPDGDIAVIEAYREITSYLLLNRTHHEARAFFGKVDELRNMVVRNNDAFNLIKHRLFSPDVLELSSYLCVSLLC
eukprot:snap_masked-scaffold_20-processed-gene-1.4-mRNA-1 protein AED:1.00 eAED:1.00 QI:0/-1/0/0/-1/1/1/0/475